MRKHPSRITTADRLQFGFLSPRELADLKACSIGKVYADIRAGRLPSEKHGGARRIAGPIARDYRPDGRRGVDYAPHK